MVVPLYVHIIHLTLSLVDWTVPQGENNRDSDSDSEDEVVEIISPIQESRPLQLSDTFDFDSYQDDVFNFYPTPLVASGSGTTSSGILQSIPQHAAESDTIILSRTSDTTSNLPGSASVSTALALHF